MGADLAIELRRESAEALLRPAVKVCCCLKQPEGLSAVQGIVHGLPLAGKTALHGQGCLDGQASGLFVDPGQIHPVRGWASSDHGQQLLKGIKRSGSAVRNEVCCCRPVATDPAEQPLGIAFTSFLGVPHDLTGVGVETAIQSEFLDVLGVLGIEVAGLIAQESDQGHAAALFVKGVDQPVAEAAV